MSKALQQAKEARLHILSKMEEALPKHRSNLSVYAPKVYQGMIPVDRIGEFIGPGGKNIKALCEEYECEINIEDSGQCIIMGVDAAKMEKALDVVNSYSLVPEVGDIFDAEVVKTLDFGAFVKVAPGKEGLVHISEIALERVNKVEDHLKVGQKVKVKLVKIDDQGRAGYSIKALLKKEQNA
jgi:polyribonucleotide nucleotidyltransferase